MLESSIAYYQLVLLCYPFLMIFVILQARLQVPEEVLQELRSLNELDLELYEYARAIFYKQHKTSLRITEV